ncbi:hypothetical protein FVE85_9602 [Porphyridium purpureum]|uniref:Uncharacterized protein n=1 Tax=Porphyridium purpureum TaxID=35688 RepID=A0A5J4YHM8_PORPP|nr:hypothetical protein FVE85_9602 [Porphyridium purpureum]|eukprot:POR6178..scf267_23
MSVSEVRDAATNLGIEPVPRQRAGLLRALREHRPLQILNGETEDAQDVIEDHALSGQSPGDQAALDIGESTRQLLSAVYLSVFLLSVSSSYLFSLRARPDRLVRAGASPFYTLTSARDSKGPREMTMQIIGISARVWKVLEPLEAFRND